jgi:hypothetical protein
MLNTFCPSGNFIDKLECLKTNATNLCKHYRDNAQKPEIDIDGVGTYDPCIQKFQDGSSVDQMILSILPPTKVEQANCAQQFCGVDPTPVCMENFKTQICNCCIQSGSNPLHRDICNTLCTSKKQDCLKKVCGSNHAESCIQDTAKKNQLCNCCKENKISCVFHSEHSKDKKVQPCDNLDASKTQIREDFRKPGSMIEFNPDQSNDLGYSRYLHWILMGLLLVLLGIGYWYSCQKQP